MIKLHPCLEHDVVIVTEFKIINGKFAKHYMVDIGNTLKEIVELVNEGDYFPINRARQYGKTTTSEGFCHAFMESLKIMEVALLSALYIKQFNFIRHIQK